MPHLNFTADDWARVERDTMAWWNGELDRPLVHMTVSDPLSPEQARQRPWSYQSNYPLDMPAEDVVDCYEHRLASHRYYADAYPHLWLNFGPGIAAGFLGARVESVTDPSETVWFTPARRQSIADLNLAFDPHNAWLVRVKELTRAFTERYGGLLQTSMTDLGGNLDILASFLTTEQLLFDVVEQPNEVLRQVRQITDLWLRYYAEIDALIRPTCRGTSCWTPIWSTGSTYMLQCDFSYMIGPKMFERFVMPDLAACCDFFDHAFYHLDGKGEVPHLDLLLSLDRLRGIQWIPGDGQPAPDQWLPLLKRIRDGGKLCQVFVSPEGARHIVSHLGGKGFLLIVNTTGAGFENPAVAQAFLDTLRREDSARS